jgi:hypothetical protein
MTDEQLAHLYPGRPTGAAARARAIPPGPDLVFDRMRLIVARCAVHYTGRLTARLPEALRLIMIKADGSVLVHADAGGYKPLNCSLT